MSESPHLVVGLGNPGPEYESTRHNAGARAVEILAARLGARLKRSRLPALVVDVRDGDARMVLARPTTYMNESGRAVARLCSYFKIPLDRLVVVYDEIDLEFGRLRVREGGGTAGHQGLNSIVSALGSPDFARVRIGVGRPPGRKDPAAYVLEPFSSRERETVEVLLEEAADAVLAIVREGVAAAQNRFNATREA